jgi:hypothetical protein
MRCKPESDVRQILNWYIIEDNEIRHFRGSVTLRFRNQYIQVLWRKRLALKLFLSESNSVKTDKASIAPSLEEQYVVQPQLSAWFKVIQLH